MPRLTGLDRNKPEIWKKRYLKRAIELGFNKSFAHIFQFPVPRARFPLLLPVPRFSRNFSIGRRDGSENVASKMNLRSSSRLFQLTYFVNCRQTLPELNF